MSSLSQIVSSKEFKMFQISGIKGISSKWLYVDMFDSVEKLFARYISLIDPAEIAKTPEYSRVRNIRLWEVDGFGKYKLLSETDLLVALCA